MSLCEHGWPPGKCSYDGCPNTEKHWTGKGLVPAEDGIEARMRETSDILQRMVEEMVAKTEGEMAKFLNEAVREALVNGANFDDMRIEHHGRPMGRRMELWHRDTLMATAEVTISQDGARIVTRRPRSV